MAALSLAIDSKIRRRLSFFREPVRQWTPRDEDPFAGPASPFEGGLRPWDSRERRPGGGGPMRRDVAAHRHHHHHALQPQAEGGQEGLRGGSRRGRRLQVRARQEASGGRGPRRPRSRPRTHPRYVSGLDLELRNLPRFRLTCVIGP